MHLKYSRIDDYTKDEINNFIDKIYTLKRNKIKKITNQEKNKKFIIGEIILSKLLKKYYNLDYSKLKFNINKFGKPYIVDKNIFYNISHSNSYVVVVISDKEIGIDLEKIRPVDLKTINYFATEFEKKYILKDKNNIEKRLFEIYTLKEAYFKMKGENLNKIKEIEFTISNNSISCNDKLVSLKLNYIIPNYIIAICEINN